MSNYVFGIDLGGTTVKCGLFTVEGVVLDKWEIKTNKENKFFQVWSEALFYVSCPLISHAFFPLGDEDNAFLVPEIHRPAWDPD